MMTEKKYVIKDLFTEKYVSTKEIPESPFTAILSNDLSVAAVWTDEAHAHQFLDELEDTYWKDEVKFLVVPHP